jgi:hypothetical protein
MRGAFWLGSFAIMLAACHTPEPPPLPPPKPTNPTNELAAVLDASIVSDAAPQLDGIPFGSGATPIGLGGGRKRE